MVEEYKKKEGTPTNFQNVNFNHICSEAENRHSNFYFLFLLFTLTYLNIPINDSVDDFQFLIPLLACVTFLFFY